MSSNRSVVPPDPATYVVGESGPELFIPAQGGTILMTDFTPRRENLVRAVFPGAEFRDDEKPVLHGHFARFNEWNLIDSAIEGRFLERIAPGAFTKTLAEKTPKILFNHGKDPEIGDKPIAVARSVAEDDLGPAYEADLLDGLSPLIVSGLRAGAYGASYRFSIPKGKDDWSRTPAKSDYNPEGLPERTIRESQVFEFGPVTFPADAGATASVRSLTDTFEFDTLTSDPAKLAALIEAKSQALPPVEPTPVTPPESRATPAATDSPTGKEPTNVDNDQKMSPEDKASRVTELEASIKRQAEELTGTRSIEEQARWDSDTKELLQLRADLQVIAEARAFVARQLDNTGTRTEFEAPTVIRTKSVEDIYDVLSIERLPYEERIQAFKDNAQRSIDSAHFAKDASVDGLVEFIREKDVRPSAEEAGAMDGEAAKRVLLTGSPVYKRAFAKYLRHGNDRAFTPEESRAAALAVTGTTTTGGYAVPYIFDPTLIHIGAHTAVNPYRAACRVETISGGNNWRAVTASAITAKWDTEAAASVEGGPTFGQPTFTVQRADAFATVSIETLQDRPDITAELSTIFSEAKDNLEENSFTLGAGTTVYPQGMFLSGAFTVQSTATNDVTAIADLLLLEAALPIRHRQAAGAAMFMSRSTQRQLEALDTTGYYFKRPGQIAIAAGMPLQSNSPTGNTGTQVLGYPIWEVPSAVSTLTTDAAVIVVFADPKNYVIVDRVGMNVEVVPTMLNGATPSFPTGQRGIYCYWRATARVLNVDGGRQLDVN